MRQRNTASNWSRHLRRFSMVRGWFVGAGIYDCRPVSLERSIFVQGIAYLVCMPTRSSHCLPRKHKVSVESRQPSTLPAKQSDLAEQEDRFPIKIERTFIHVKIPSSLRTEPSEGPRTASSTDADARALPNPRSYVKPHRL